MRKSHGLQRETTMTKPTRTCAIYLRVSTGGQSVENQRLELVAAAARNGWEIVRTFEDRGFSGAKGRDQRPALNKMLEAVARREFDIVGAWSVDRLGRSLQDLVATLGELHAKKVDLYLHQQGLDTTTPAGRALFQMLGVFAEFERSIIVERVRAGLARARKEGRHLGRPKVGAGVEAAIRKELKAGTGIRKAARQLGVGTSTVARVRAEMRGAA
jgi:DNA invertase Pin-like site-specific DNA recombinase